MNRRAVLTAIVGGASLSGCLSDGDDSPGGSATPSTENPSTELHTTLSKGTDTSTPVRYTSDDVEASFRVTDSHRPTDDTASATFDGPEVTVTGTMDPSGCNRPVLTDVRYNTNDQSVHLSVGGESRFGETATVECGNASYDYRCTITVDSGHPEAVEVVHDYDGKDNQSFNLQRT